MLVAPKSATLAVTIIPVTLEGGVSTPGGQVDNSPDWPKQLDLDSRGSSVQGRYNPTVVLRESFWSRSFEQKVDGLR